MKISRICLGCLAGVVYLLSCNTSFAEFIKGDKTDSYYLCAYKKIASQDIDSKQLALESARLEAIAEFIRFALSEKLILPEEFKPFNKKIIKNLEFSFSSYKIKELNVLKSLVLKDGRAVCVLEIPKYNVENFPTLDFSKSQIEILEKLKSAKTLSLELSLILGKVDIKNLFSKGTILNSVINNEAISYIPTTWIDDVNITKDILASLDDNALLDCLELYWGIQGGGDSILLELKARGFSEIYKLLRGKELPQKSNRFAIENFETDIRFINILLNNNAAIDFLDSSAKNEKFIQAQLEFNSKSPDLAKLRGLILESFSESLSSDSMNLLGRSFEENLMYKEAIVIYFQTLSMNKNQPYAKYNLANCYYKISNPTEALFWINETLSDSSSSNWAKESARNLLDLINTTQEKTL